MPTYLSPGVYVEERKGAPAIVPVGTSTAAFLGEVPDNVTMPQKSGVFLPPFTTGTITYVQSTNVVTLTGGTWPDITPGSKLVFNNKSYDVGSKLSGTTLNLQGFRHVVSQLLRKHKYRKRKALKKKTMGPRNPNRNAQFENIARLKKEYLKAGLPVISMDTKKKELLGNFYREGKIDTQETIETNDHDFGSAGVGTVIPHSLYDVGKNKGFVHLNTSHDTSELACDSLAAWWEEEGRAYYPKAKKLLLLCDGGGSNSATMYLFKEDLQKLAVNKPSADITTATPFSLLVAAYYAVAPALVPQLITNFDQFTTLFGDFQTSNVKLAHGVYGFFLNGGSRCYVVRVASLTAGGASTQIDNALTALGAIDEISMVAAPGQTDSGLQTKIFNHCQPPDHPYRIAILDGQQNPSSPTSVSAITGSISNSDRAALYFPWIQVTNPLFDPTNSSSTKNVSVAPSGHLAGIMARVDQLEGVFYSPANEIVRGALALDYYLGKSEQDGLNPSGINLIRSFRDGLKVWGARTLGGDANGDTKYINVRRTLIFIAQSLDEGTQFVVFKPNTPTLWQQVKRTITAFLTNLWRDGGLFGTQPEQAFFVRVDETNNPPEVRALGQLIIEVGVAIALPAEFVIIRIQQFTQIPTS